MNHLGNYSTYLSPYYQNSFFSNLDFLFSVLGSMVSKNIGKLRHKLTKSKILPKLTWSWQNKPWYMLISPFSILTKTKFWTKIWEATKQNTWKNPLIWSNDKDTNPLQCMTSIKNVIFFPHFLHEHCFVVQKIWSNICPFIPFWRLRKLK